MKMLIGLTGRTGSGKTTAAQIFEKLGAFVADCDKIAHIVILEDSVKEALRKEFSDAIFESDGNVNRKKLGSIVFADKEKLASLNKIMHKAIVDKALSMCEASGKDICLIDGSELESSGADNLCDKIVVITADEDVRLKRIMARDSIDRESALMRIHAQKDYSKEAIFVSNNNSDDSLEKEITALYNKFIGDI